MNSKEYERQLSERFDLLAQRENNSDGYDSRHLRRNTLISAENLIGELFNFVISAGNPWHTPFISSDEDGYITAAWHKGDRELHLEIEENEVEYTKIWGKNHEMKMEIDSLDSGNLLTLWEWLIDGQ